MHITGACPAHHWAMYHAHSSALPVPLLCSQFDEKVEAAIANPTTSKQRKELQRLGSTFVGDVTYDPKLQGRQRGRGMEG